MSPVRLTGLTIIAMIAFAGNSLLCRLALGASGMDAASFTSIRVLSGAITLALLAILQNRKVQWQGNWVSAAALMAYAAGFSFAYVTLAAATGALILFGAVQATMIGYGLSVGERPNLVQFVGIGLAVGGLVVLLLPGLESPPLSGSLLMLVAGVAWGVYSLRGRGTGNAIETTAGNFIRAVPISLVISAFMFSHAKLDTAGVIYALASGVLASGAGYAVWYSVLPSLKATSAATFQLSVPVIAALGGVLFLGEPVSWRLALISCAILGGVGIYIMSNSKPASAQ